MLAINRGEREGVLKVSVEMEREAALIPVRRAVLNPGPPPWPSSALPPRTPTTG